MKMLLLTILLAVSMLSVKCRLPADPQTADDTVQAVPVTLDIPQKTGDGASTYRVTITGDDIDTIGPLQFATTQPVTISVPAGNDIHIFCAMYDGKGILVEAATITADITDATRQISIPLAKENQPPLITRQPVSITASAAKEVTFSVAASGKELKFQWQRGTSEITGATDSVYKTTLSATENGATFRCIASNYSGSDTSNYATFYLEGSLRDTIPPVITMGEPVFYVEIGSTFVDPGIMCIDNGNVMIPQSSVVTSGTVNTSVVGANLLTYTVADAAGNIAIATRTVIVTATPRHDPMPPVITLLGTDTIYIQNSMPLAEYIASYKEPGFKAFDDYDGDLTGRVTISDFIQLDTAVWYKAYDVIDAAGNRAATKKRFFITLLPGNPSPPVITLNLPDSVIRLELPATGPAIWKEPGYYAIDAIDGDITSKVVVDLSELIPNLSKIGNYVVTYSVTNSSGLTAKRTRKVQIYEQIICYTPPRITLKGKNPDTVLYKSVTEYADPGCVAIDNRDGDITAIVMRTGNVDVATLGKYTLTYSVTDKAGNRANATRIIWVVRDTANDDLLTAYAVPTASPLPTLRNKTYTKWMVDGDGPDLSAITKINFSWEAEMPALASFLITYKNEPYNKSFISVTQTFKSAGPTLTMKNSQIPGLDGTYYVATQGTEFYWVESSGKFAIVWQE